MTTVFGHKKRRQISAFYVEIQDDKWMPHLNGGSPFMTLFDRLRALELAIKAKLLTCELEIVLHLYHRPHMSAGELFRSSRHSSTSFYATLKRLTHDGLLEVAVDQRDRRSNVYALSGGLAAAIRGCLEPINDGH